MTTATSVPEPRDSRVGSIGVLGVAASGAGSSTPSSGRGISGATATAWQELARRAGVPWTDTLLVGLNLHGLATDVGPRTRLQVALDGESDERLVVVPSGRPRSPFTLANDELRLAGVPVARVHRVDADDAVASYLRCRDASGTWRAATINPNARSRCTGCVFCPTAMEQAVDPRLLLEAELHQLVQAMAAELALHGGSLTDLVEITVSTGCFHTEAAALDHVITLRRVLNDLGLSVRIGLLTSVLRTDEAFARINAEVGDFLLLLTAECATRRDALLKHSKAELTADEMPDLLARARVAGLDTTYTYVAGLDPLPDAIAFNHALIANCTVFPSVQTFQAHSPVMDVWRTRGADRLGYYLALRRAVEQSATPIGLIPDRWRCYRSLWYSSFDCQPLTTPVR